MANPRINNMDVKVTWQAGLVFALVVVAVIAGLMYAIPRYRVWAAEMRGRAELSQAEFNKQIIVREAEARLEAERLNAQAEVARAEGASEAMYAVQDALTETYIRYLWVRTMQGNQNIIYVPTEAGLPILEAGQRP
jgi:regulator of protease activity HflC (stomatin/prohibitin superfamily)